MEEEAGGPEGKKSREVILEKNRPKGKHREFRDRSRRHQLLGALDGLSSQEGGWLCCFCWNCLPSPDPRWPFLAGGAGAAGFPSPALVQPPCLWSCPWEACSCQACYLTFRLPCTSTRGGPGTSQAECKANFRDGKWSLGSAASCSGKQACSPGTTLETPSEG